MEVAKAISDVKALNLDTQEKEDSVDCKPGRLRSFFNIFFLIFNNQCWQAFLEGKHEFEKKYL